MAVLDRRLVPLIEMLTDVGLDWLAFEIIDGVRRGREPEESPDALALARARVRGTSQEVEPFWKVSIGFEFEPIAGDEQLGWAARYVEERFEATLGEMAAVLTNLDRITFGSSETRKGDRGAGATLVLQSNEEERVIGRDALDAAHKVVPELRLALANWLQQTRTETDT